MSRPPSSVVVLTVTALVMVAGWGAPRSGRGQERAAVPESGPGATELLRSVPFDRLTLTDGTVVIVEPVSPRPLPAYDPTKERERRKRGVQKNGAQPFELGEPGKATRSGAADGGESGQAEEDAVDSVRIHLLQAGPNELRDYKVKRASIKKLEYFEDLLLQESQRLMLARDFARAFECCFRVRMRNPGWAGLDDQVNRVLFAEGTRALIDGDPERGLRLLRELLGRNRDYPGLVDQLATAYGKRIERSLSLGLYARGRRVLHELEEMAPQHPVVRTLHDRFVSLAAERVKEAEAEPKAADGGYRLDAVESALRIWPALPGARALYDSAFAAVPTLDVGVVDVAAPLGPWVHSRADARVTRLLYAPILTRDDKDAREGKTLGQLAASVETSELGRRLSLRIRPDVTWSDGSRPASAIDVAHALIDRSDPHSPNYEARWADLLDRVEIPAENRVEVRLNQASLRAGGWLLGPVGPAHAGMDGRIAASAQERLLVSNGAYRCVAAADDRVELRLRDDPGATSSRTAEGVGAAPGIRRIREVRLARGQAAVTALRRGEVTLIDHVPPDQLAALAEMPEIQIGRYAQPVVHLIALDGRNPALRSRALRRGLSYAVDRKTLLEEDILKHPATDPDGIADGPFPKGSYADASAVKPLGFDMLLAKMLVAAARKERGGSPISLRFEYPAIPEVRKVAARLAELFQTAGVDVVALELPESRLETELRAGRRFDLAYRVVRCDDPILDAGPLLCPGYDAPPQANTLASAASPRILQLLLQLDRASDWPSARGLATQVDRESRDELPVIPLWQLADHFAWRDRLKGPQTVADRLYQAIETWEIAPWIAIDPWEPAGKAASP